MSRRSMASRPSPDRRHFNVLVGERELDDALNRDAVIGQEKLMRHRGVKPIVVFIGPNRARRVSAGRGRLGLNEIDDFLHRRAGPKHRRHAHRLQGWQICIGNDAAEHDEDVSESVLAQQVHQSVGKSSCAHPRESTAQ